MIQIKAKQHNVSFESYGHAPLRSYLENQKVGIKAGEFHLFFVILRGNYK